MCIKAAKMLWSNTPKYICPLRYVSKYPLNSVFLESGVVCSVKIRSGDICLKIQITLLTFGVNQSKHQLLPRRVLEKTNCVS